MSSADTRAPDKDRSQSDSPVDETFALNSTPAACPDYGRFACITAPFIVGIVPAMA